MKVPPIPPPTSPYLVQIQDSEFIGTFDLIPKWKYRYFKTDPEKVTFSVSHYTLIKNYETICFYKATSLSCIYKEIQFTTTVAL